MTVDFLIYAVGGGSGHAVRGSVIQSLVTEAGKTSVLVVRPRVRHGGRSAGHRVEWTPDGTSFRNICAKHLVVDTFPSGWREELDTAFLRRFSSRIFIARFHRSLDWRMVSEDFDRILLPYDGSLCEWDDAPASARPTGFFLREGVPRYHHDSDELVLVDPEQRCSPHLRSVFARLAAEAGRDFQCVSEMGSNHSGGKFLFAGAGYNTFFEALEQRIDARFIPVRKRHDDQHRRVARFERGAQSLLEIREWLRQAPVQGAMFRGPSQSFHSVARCPSAECFLT